MRLRYKLDAEVDINLLKKGYIFNFLNVCDWQNSFIVLTDY